MLDTMSICTKCITLQNSDLPPPPPPPPPHTHSLPRHKVSGKLKGFGFVEFSTQEEAQNALEVDTVVNLLVHAVVTAIFVSVPQDVSSSI